MGKPHIRPATQDERQRLLKSPDEPMYACDGDNLDGRSFGNTPHAAHSAWLEGLAFAGRLPEEYHA